MRDAFSQSTTSVSPAAPLLLTARDAAKALAISERTLWASSVPRGPIPVTRLPGVRSIRYSVDALREWVASQQQQSQA